MYATIDIETTGLNRFKDKVTWIGIGLSKGLDEPFFKEYYLDMRADKNLDKFCQVVDRLREKKVKTVFQNGKFDTLFIEAQYGVKLPIHEDVMLMGTAYDLADEHGLKPMAQRYLGVPDWDISKKEKLSGDDSIIPYLKCDVRYTWRLFCYFKDEMSPQQTKIYKKILLPAYLMYRDTERNGIYIDLDKLKEVRKMFKDREKEKLDWLKNKYDINWNSPAQIAEVLFEKEGMPVMKKSQKTNKPSADAEVLNKLARKGYEIPQVLLEYKSANTLNKMFLNRWEDDLGFDKRIHPSFNLTNVVTGRTSCLISGTKIRMADGSVKDIENVVPGNKVCCKTAKGISKGTVTWSGCTGIRNDLYRITAALETDPMTTRGIILTSDHPVLTTTRGFVRADRLKIGEMLIGFKENVRIIHIKKIHMGTKVYDLTVEKDHNFFANDICVHNCSDPNLQQVPREKSVRGMFDAPKGRLFFEADYSQLELRIAAEYSHDPVMLDIYKNKGDIHTTTAKLMTGGREPTKEERSKAKAVNFGRQ